MVLIYNFIINLATFYIAEGSISRVDSVGEPYETVIHTPRWFPLEGIIVKTKGYTSIGV